jgi:hypothetical protein
VPDVTAALDETGATTLVNDAESALGTLPASGSGALGPFTASWTASASFSGGTVDLIAPDTIRLTNCTLNYSVGFSFSFDLSSIIPDFCLPRVCIPTPWGDICTPTLCINWPTVTIPVSYADSLMFTADFTLAATLSGGVWKIEIVIAGVPSLTISAAAAAIVTAIGLAAALVLAPIPFIGPLLAIAVAGIAAAVGIAGVTGLLGPILGGFLAGRRFTIYEQPQLFEVVPAAGPDPAVNVTLDAIAASVQSTDEDELVIGVDYSP